MSGPTAPTHGAAHGRRLPGLPAWIRQGLACLLLFVLSARLPPHLLALLTALARGGSGADHGPAEAVLLLLADGFGVVCAIYLSHASMRGVKLLRCYPPRRLIPLELHLLGLVWGLLSLAPPSAGASG